MFFCHDFILTMKAQGHKDGLYEYWRFCMFYLFFLPYGLPAY
jgi:hypothetical protein